MLQGQSIAVIAGFGEMPVAMKVSLQWLVGREEEEEEEDGERRVRGRSGSIQRR